MSIASTGLSHDERRILRIAAVVTRTSLSRTTIWRLVKAKVFPSPIEISERAVGWYASEVDAYLEQRAKRREARS
jgi:prophage regulatory protein